MRPEFMQVILAIGVLLVLASFWRSHRDPNTNFNLFDLLMENGRVSKISVGYMVVMGVSTWVVVNQELHGRLSDGTFGVWLGAWVAPILTRMATKSNDNSEGVKQ